MYTVTELVIDDTLNEIHAVLNNDCDNHEKKYKFNIDRTSVDAIADFYPKPKEYPNVCGDLNGITMTLNEIKDSDEYLISAQMVLQPGKQNYILKTVSDNSQYCESNMIYDYDDMYDCSFFNSYILYLFAYTSHLIQKTMIGSKMRICVDVSLVNRNIDYVDTNPDNFVLFEDGIYAPIIPNKIKPLRFFYVDHLGLFNHMRDGDDDDDRLNENIIEFFDNDGTVHNKDLGLPLMTNKFDHNHFHEYFNIFMYLMRHIPYATKANSPLAMILESEKVMDKSSMQALYKKLSHNASMEKYNKSHTIKLSDYDSFFEENLATNSETMSKNSRMEFISSGSHKEKLISMATYVIDPENSYISQSLEHKNYMESMKMYFKFTVEEADNQDNSIITINTYAMENLGLYRGDEVKLVSAKHKYTIAILMNDDDCEEKQIKMNKVVRKNLGVKMGDFVIIERHESKYCKSIHVKPIEDTLKGTTENLMKTCLEPYFSEIDRPVHEGDYFTCRGVKHQIEFKIVKTDPDPFCLVAPGAKIYCKGKITKKEIKSEKEAEKLNEDPFLKKEKLIITPNTEHLLFKAFYHETKVAPLKYIYPDQIINIQHNKFVLVALVAHDGEKFISGNYIIFSLEQLKENQEIYQYVQYDERFPTLYLPKFDDVKKRLDMLMKRKCMTPYLFLYKRI